jgi:uncharacterized delta-60 repeat protein
MTPTQTRLNFADLYMVGGSNIGSSVAYYSLEYSGGTWFPNNGLNAIYNLGNNSASTIADIIFLENRWFAVGNTETSGGTIARSATSLDGISNWTTIDGINNVLQRVDTTISQNANNSRYVVGGLGDNYELVWSDDLVTWTPSITLQTIGVEDFINEISYLPNSQTFTAVGVYTQTNTGFVYNSTDNGETFGLVYSASSSLNSIVYGNPFGTGNIAWIVGDAGWNAFSYGSSGIVYTNSAFPGNPKMVDVFFNPTSQVFMAVGDEGKIFTISTGFTWTDRSLTDTSINLTSIYSDGSATIAVGLRGTSPVTLINYANDGIVWGEITNNLPNTLQPKSVYYRKQLNITPTPTRSSTPTPTPTYTPTNTATQTYTPSQTQTSTQTYTPSQTQTPTYTPSQTQTATQTPTITPTRAPINNCFGSGFNEAIFSLEQPDGKLLIGGVFSAYSGITGVNRIVRLNTDGTIDNTFNTGIGFNNIVFDMVLQPDGKVIVAGAFTNYSGISVNNIVRLNTNGTLDTSFTSANQAPNVRSIILQPDGKIVYSATYNIYRLNSNGSFDTSYSAGTTNDQIQKIILDSNNKILMTGNFTEFNNTPTTSFIRLNTNGTYANSIDVGGAAYDMILQPDGKVLVGGFVNSQKGIVRLNVNDSVDTTFNVGSGFTATIPPASVEDMELQQDGKVIVSGYFTSFSGIPVGNVVRLNSDGSLDTSFNSGTGVVAGVGNVYDITIQANGLIVLGGLFSSYSGLSVGNIVRLNSNGSINDCSTPQPTNTSTPTQTPTITPSATFSATDALIVNNNNDYLLISGDTYLDIQ